MNWTLDSQQHGTYWYIPQKKPLWWDWGVMEYMAAKASTCNEEVLRPQQLHEWACNSVNIAVFCV
jgi:hypothetical protein